MAPASLVAMVQNTVGRNVDNLQDLGDITYELARPILRQVRNPEQLRHLELASPQFDAYDAELWKAFIVRDIPNWESIIPEPNNLAYYRYDVYCKLKERDQKERQAQEDQLRQALTQLDQKKKANLTPALQKLTKKDIEQLPRRVDQKAPEKDQGVLAVPLERLCNGRRAAPTAPTLRNAKGGTQIMQALRQQSRQAVQSKRLNKPFGPTPMALPQRKPVVVTRFAERPSDGEISRRLEADRREKAKAAESSRREVKNIVRRERAQEVTAQTSTPAQPHTSPQSQAPVASIHSTPLRTTPAQSAYLSPPLNPHRPQPREMQPTPPRHVSGPFKKRASPNTTPPQDTSRAELARKLSDSPVPTITLNEEEKPKIPVHVLPASQRRGPVSIFAPRVKRRRVV